MNTTANKIRNKIFSVADWVDSTSTADLIEYGDPDREIKKVGVSWMANFENLQAAGLDGCDLFISHEPCFMDYWRRNNPDYRATEWGKLRLSILEKYDMTCMAFHDTWDNFPKYGIRDSWRSFLGFDCIIKEMPYLNPTTHTYAKRKSLTLNKIKPTRLGDYAQELAGKISRFNTNGLLLNGNEDAVIETVAVGVGCHIPSFEMQELGADLLIQVFDRAFQTMIRIPCAELGANIITLEHGVPEMPGMMNMLEYLKTQWPDLQAEFYNNETFSKFIINK